MISRNPLIGVRAEKREFGRDGQVRLLRVVFVFGSASPH